MDQVIVRAKLDTLRYRVERVEACVPERYEDLIDNPDTEDLVVHNFNQAAGRLATATVPRKRA